MEILIDVIRIAGFRGVSQLEIYLPRVTVLIGANNSGKTSVIKALQLALGDYSRFLSEEDFFISASQERSTEIKIDIRVVPVVEEGKRVGAFSAQWVDYFADSIQSDVSGNQFVALRTTCRPNLIKGGFDTVRCTLDKWVEYSDWKNVKIKENKFVGRWQNIPLIPIDAQRDIHFELRDKTSFVGKVLSSVTYDSRDIELLEGLIKSANDEAVKKSSALQSLKENLELLSKSFHGVGCAEITPLPKKIRDLSKYFSISFGESSDSSFSMEYHGMGTRSWASMLTVKSFLDIAAKKYKEEEQPFFPVLAAEEPEAHLHPSAQKTLYGQLASTRGQVIISTHSPYLAAMAEQDGLRCIRRTGDTISVGFISENSEPEDRRRLHREVIHSRGEILFSKALVLCEGETEEQALPILFRAYFGCEPFVLGVNFIGVGGSGKKYLPFFQFAKNFFIPCFVFSDGEVETLKTLKKNYEIVFGEVDVNNSPYLTVLDNSDFEGYLLSSGYRDLAIETIAELDGVDALSNWMKTRDGSVSGRVKTALPPCEACNQPIFANQVRDYKVEQGENMAIIEIFDSSKPKYAPVFAEKISTLEVGKFPAKVVELFEKIKKGAF
ncbi:putative ATP-dependent endonuclease of the OLD family [Pseudomonas grimontii]|uniref:ATP-dependent endonuclease of the OLD family n=1 Tax=Pseudomonas grimontii TaxID=129847 RepID=A0A1H1B6G6_9PSED|nr:AAA family ATPase [Pseudomonas grimontii]TWR63638.1 DUF2813 domain-containing protein [Pseudomonas grimontii]SDQ47545.1 putative ATP-dependent endonuclease of the OLD family [Pseudomonas grimontii]